MITSVSLPLAMANARCEGSTCFGSNGQLLAVSVEHVAAGQKVFRISVSGLPGSTSSGDDDVVDDDDDDMMTTMMLMCCC